MSHGGSTRRWSGTTKRLLAGFGALVCILAVASYFALAGLHRIHRAIARMRVEEEGVRVALELSSAVRDQYAHQAHTIIIGDESHLGFYTAAEKRVLELTGNLRPLVTEPDERAWMDDIEAASADLDAIFRERIVPAVVRGDRRFVQDEHARAQLVVTRIQDRAEQLVNAFEGRIGASRAEVDAVDHRTGAWIIALLAGAPVLAAGVTLVIGRTIAVPLGRLQAGAARLAQGDLDTRLPADAPDEFGALAAQFNAMAAALKEHQEKLVQSEKLAGVGRLAAGVAHEINNPLGVILGYAKLLARRAEGEQADDLRVIQEEALRCKEIVEGLLDLSRPVPEGRERVELRDACDEVVARLRDAAALDGVEVTVVGAASVEAHAGKLRQIVANLVRNAAEAAGRGGRIEVRLEERDGVVALSVADSGAGLDAAARQRLFEPFFTTKERGTGLGLAISRAIARAHGGDIAAENRAGGGARFTLRLPRAAPSAGGTA